MRTITHQLGSSMNNLSITELELLTFFECEPELRDQGEPWHLNDALYHYSDENHTISFAIDSAYKDVRIILANGDKRLYELNALSVADVMYFKHAENELLELQLNTDEKLLIKLRPYISIQHAAGENNHLQTE